MEKRRDAEEEIISSIELVQNIRPTSMYENIQENTLRMLRQKEKRPLESDYDDIETSEALIDDKDDGGNRPSITFFNQTTVPQNIAAGKLSGRHTPTRSSLRHSRMIVLNKAGKVTNSQPIREINKVFIVFEILKTSIGVIITAIAVWLLIWTPSLKTLDKPYWCGIPLLLSGIYGLFSIVCCFKRKRKRCSTNCFIEVVGALFTLISGILCCIAFIFIIIHSVTLSQMVCSPVDSMNSTCSCQESDIMLQEDLLPDNKTADYKIYSFNSFHFIDLTCTEIKEIIVILLIILGITTAIGFIISFVYIYFICFKSFAFSKRKYINKEVFS